MDRWPSPTIGVILRRRFGFPTGLKSRPDVNRTETYLMIDSKARKRRSHSITRKKKWFQPTDNDDDATSSLGFFRCHPKKLRINPAASVCSGNEAASFSLWQVPSRTLTAAMFCFSDATVRGRGQSHQLEFEFALRFYSRYNYSIIPYSRRPIMTVTRWARFGCSGTFSVYWSSWPLPLSTYSLFSSRSLILQWLGIDADRGVVSEKPRSLAAGVGWAMILADRRRGSAARKHACVNRCIGVYIDRFYAA